MEMPADYTIQELINPEIKKFEEVMCFIHSIMPVYNTEAAKLPYHINILDLIWANENAHSRILAHLISQKTGKEFEVLNSFIKDLLKIRINSYDSGNPVISYEKDRIDVLILAKTFALIIENKIHGAVDQQAQIACYIDKVKAKGYSEERIFVVYLTRDGSKEINEQSWVNAQGKNYKQQFATRFQPISYKEHILPWLRHYILPNCRFKDVYLRSTLEQYIDYLEGIFNIRQINKDMNEKLSTHIKDLLKLNNTPEVNLKVVKAKIDELLIIKDQLEELATQEKADFWEQWKKYLAVDFNKYPQVESDYDNGPFKERTVGITMKYNEIPFNVAIESEEGKIFYGFYRYEEKELIPEVADFLKNIFQGEGSTLAWYNWKWTSYETAYADLTELIRLVESKLQVIENITS